MKILLCKLFLSLIFIKIVWVELKPSTAGGHNDDLINQWNIMKLNVTLTYDKLNKKIRDIGIEKFKEVGSKIMEISKRKYSNHCESYFNEFSYHIKFILSDHIQNVWCWGWPYLPHVYPREPVLEIIKSMGPILDARMECGNLESCDDQLTIATIASVMWIVKSSRIFLDEKMILDEAEECYNETLNNVLKITSQFQLTRETCESIKNYDEFLKYIKLFPLKWTTLEQYQSEEVVMLLHELVQVQSIIDDEMDRSKFLIDKNALHNTNMELAETLASLCQHGRLIYQDLYHRPFCDNDVGVCKRAKTILKAKEKLKINMSSSKLDELSRLLDILENE